MVKRLEPTERRDQILKAAVDLARGRGYHDLTRDSIAEAAGVSFGLVSRYFGTIGALKQKVMEEAVAEGILQIVAAGLAIGDPVARSAPPELKVRAAKLISS